MNSTNHKHVNVAPGFVLAYEWSKPQAEHLDQSGQLVEDIALKIREGFKLIDVEPSFVKQAL